MRNQCCARLAGGLGSRRCSEPHRRKPAPCRRENDRSSVCQNCPKRTSGAMRYSTVHGLSLPPLRSMTLAGPAADCPRGCEFAQIEAGTRWYLTEAKWSPTRSMLRQTAEQLSPLRPT